MSKDIIQGEKLRIKGKLKVMKGRIIGSPIQVAQGKLMQKKGNIKKKIGKAKYRL
jgi:uncharacterized protein YjbJ (UPF0337 family)